MSSTEDKADQVIHIWVLNGGIIYSSSGVPKATPAIKLLYQLITPEQADKMLEGLTCDAQEISLPASAMEDVVQHLEESNLLLPGSERRLKDWKVGLLAR
jgi:ubiquitin-protein ligase E3 D